MYSLEKKKKIFKYYFWIGYYIVILFKSVNYDWDYYSNTNLLD